MASLSARTRSAILYVSRRAHDSASKAANIASDQTSADSSIPVPKPFTHQLQRFKRLAPHILSEEFAAEGYHDYSVNRLYDYYKTAEFVRALTTPAERIAFVSPYERPWRQTEKKWHRLNMPPLHVPRKAWCLSAIPDYFDSEEFYMFITRTQQPLDENLKPVDGQLKRDLWKECYRGVVMPVKSFEKRVTESLICTLDGRPEFDKQSSSAFLKRFVDDALFSLAHTNLLIDQRLSQHPRCESFWICAGFEDLYLNQNMVTGHVGRYTRGLPKVLGDHRQKLGELVFTMRDELSVQIRQKTPLNGLDLFGSKIDRNFPANKDYFDEFTPLGPGVYKLKADEDPLWQCPGYEPECNEPYPFGRLALKNVYDLNENMNAWGWKTMSEEEQRGTRLSCLRATAISSLFNWMNGQAHCQGYTQYTDDDSIDLTSQLVLSDGREFFFAVGQLRTIAFNINWKRLKDSNPSRAEIFIDRTPNRAIFEGPYNLFDEYDSTTNSFRHRDPESGEMKAGLNPIVLDYFLGMVSVK